MMIPYHESLQAITNKKIEIIIGRRKGEMKIH